MDNLTYLVDNMIFDSATHHWLSTCGFDRFMKRWGPNPQLIKHCPSDRFFAGYWFMLEFEGHVCWLQLHQLQAAQS
jgi:hypothetical protein